MGMRVKWPVPLLAVLAAGMFASGAGAHSAYLSARITCDDQVAYTATAWEGKFAFGSPAWVNSRTNPGIGIFDTAVDATMEGSGHFNAANAFSFSGSFPAGVRTQVTVVAKVLQKWADGGHKGAVTSAVATKPDCTNPPPPPPPPGSPGGPPFVAVDGVRYTCTIVGTQAADLLTGRPGRDVICGFGGNDRIWAGAGNDLVVAGPGNDIALGWLGNDFVLGRAGADDLRGNQGVDRVRGELGNDEISGGLAADKLLGGLGADELRGGPGGDRLVGSLGKDRFFGGLGADTFLARDRWRDRLSGGLGHDRARVNCARDRRFSIETTFAPVCG